MAGPPERLTRLPIVGPLFAAIRETPSEDAVSGFAQAALEKHKHEGMELAIRARFIALFLIALSLPALVPDWGFLWYQFLLLGFIAIGLAQRRFARVGASRREIFLIIADALLMTIVIIVPNPFLADADPIAVQYRFGGFMYLFIFLGFVTLAYSWRTVWGFGVMTSAIWLAAYVLIEFGAVENPEMTAAAMAAFGEDLGDLLDPNATLGFIRVQEIIVFLIVAGILATTVRRYSVLLMGHAALERERANLARYFSPNVVEQLSQNDDPLKQVRTQNVAVLFVDIVSFTAYAADRPSDDVIKTLRSFHSLMEAEVFRHDGTLDKYLGDGLMATFGTPFAGERDATNALTCARAMMEAMEGWNEARVAVGEPPLRAAFGLHYGPAVLGDIGSNRLEFAVIGNTVNVASRVEALTRNLDCDLAATADLKAQVEREKGACAGWFDEMSIRENQPIRGLDRGLDLWTMRKTPPTMH